MAKKKQESPFTGLWHIVSMSGWDEDYFNEEVEAFIEFNANGTGHFQFGYVQGYMDWRVGTRDGQPAVEWSWEVCDGADGTPLPGRGWAKREGAELHGMISWPCKNAVAAFTPGRQPLCVSHNSVPPGSIRSLPRTCSSPALRRGYRECREPSPCWTTGRSSRAARPLVRRANTPSRPDDHRAAHRNRSRWSGHHNTGTAHGRSQQRATHRETHRTHNSNSCHFLSMVMIDLQYYKHRARRKCPKEITGRTGAEL